MRNCDGRASRREILERAARAAVTVGLAPTAIRCMQDLPARSRAAPPVQMPTFGDALARMREDAKPGVVIRFPRDPREQQRLVAAFSGALDLGDDDAWGLFSESVVVCAADDAAFDARIVDAVPGETAVLVDAAARRVDGTRLCGGALQTSGVLVGELCDLVHGTDARRLRERAAAVRATLSPVELELLETPVEWDLRKSFTPPTDYDRVFGHDRRTRTGHRELTRVVPLLVLATLEDGPRLVTLEWSNSKRLLFRYFRDFEEWDPGPALPYGLAVDVLSDSGGCGGEGPIHGRTRTSSKHACGMAMPTPASRRFIGLLAP